MVKRGDLISSKKLKNDFDRIAYIVDYVDDERDEDNLIIKELKKYFDVKVIDPAFPGVLDRSELLDIKLVLNQSPTIQGLEVAKELREFGLKVINDPKTLYFSEDKWLFYLKCKKYGIATPETILLSNRLVEVKKELKCFLEGGGIVIKSTYGYQGRFVSRANSVKEGVEIYKKFLKKTSDPLIAQRFISNSKETIRVTMIDKKIEQIILKKGPSWKVCGCGMERITRMRPNRKIKKMSREIYDIIDQKITGIDIIENDNEYYALEVNGVPSLSFIKKDIPVLTRKLIKLIRKYKE